MASPSSRDASAALSHSDHSGTFRLLYRRSVYALQSFFNPSARQDKITAADDGPGERDSLLVHGEPADGSSTSYQAVANEGGVARRRIPKPKKVQTPVRVEAKVWFANERTWISWLRVSVLLGTFAVALFNAGSLVEPAPPKMPPVQGAPPNRPPTYRQSLSKKTIRSFGVVYAFISIFVLLWALGSYHRRVSLIKKRYPGPMDDLIGPIIVSAALFVAVLLNFIIRVSQHQVA